MGRRENPKPARISLHFEARLRFRSEMRGEPLEMIRGPEKDSHLAPHHQLENQRLLGRVDRPAGWAFAGPEIVQ